MKKNKLLKTTREIVLKYYPLAQAKDVGCKSGSYFHIYSEGDYLGKGKSKEEAWNAAYNNLDN